MDFFHHQHVKGETCAGSVGPLPFSLTCGAACEQIDDGLRASAGWLRREIEEAEHGLQEISSTYLDIGSI